MLVELVVTVELSIDSENVTEIDVLVETEVFPLDGEVEETVGGVVLFMERTGIASEIIGL